MVSLWRILSCTMGDASSKIFWGCKSFLYAFKGYFWLKMRFPTIECDFSQSANSSGMRDCFLCLWAATGSSGIKDLLMSEEFLLQTLRRPCLFSSKQNKFYVKAKTQPAFQIYTVFREIRRFYFSFSCYAHLLECGIKNTDVKMGAVWDLWNDLKQIWGQSWLLDFLLA